jgi:hypothetical protein
MIILFWLIFHQIDVFFLLWLLGYFTSPSLERTIFFSFFLMGGLFCTTFFSYTRTYQLANNWSSPLIIK